MIRGAPQLQLCLFKILCYILGFLLFELFFKDFVNVVLFNWCVDLLQLTLFSNCDQPIQLIKYSDS